MRGQDMSKKIIFFIIFNYIYSAIGIDPLVATSRGLIKGLTAEDGTYSMFLGVPYAVVDEGNPFGDSIPHTGFEDTFEAYDDSAECPQYIAGNAVGIIDCLRLNIYVPNTADSRNTLPVMLYLHGGAFVEGKNKKDIFGPKFLIRHDVIVVTMNYRLGPYGFLCVSNPEYNNQGLRDQILAMRWVKDNIEAFGGDANRITVFGESAGAISLDILLLASEEKLFARMILQSGFAISPWSVKQENDGVLLRIAEYFDFAGDNVTSAIDYLSHKDPMDVVKAAYELQITNANGHPLTTPCVEKSDKYKVLGDYPINLLPKVRGLDIMIGHTNKEIMFMYPESDEEFYKNYKFSDELMKGFDEIHDENIVRQFYIGDQVTNIDVQSEIMDFGSDFVFIYPTERTVDRYLKNDVNKVYRYVFAYEGGRNEFKIFMNLTLEGASHADELGYLFDSEMLAGKTTDEDQAMIDRMTEMWTNFAKYGDPTPETSELIPVKWLPVEKGIQNYMLLDSPLAALKRPFNDRMAFWNLYYKMYGKMEKGYTNN